MGLAVEYSPSTKEVQIQAYLGSRGLIQGKSQVATFLPFEIAPADIHPVAEIEFPNKQPLAKAIKVKVILSQRC
jgi:hypothetical protein